MGALFTKFAVWLGEYFDAFLIKLKILAVGVLQLIIDSFVNVVTWILGMFPNGDALPALPSTPAGHVFIITMQTLNWLFPISFIVQMALWLGAAYLLYLVISPLARWAKLLT
jgi:hypothetical protein